MQNKIIESKTFFIGEINKESHEDSLLKIK